jgi:hypothetical protein
MNNKIDFETLQKVKDQFGNFQVGQVMGGSNDVYLRFGYWRKVDVTKLQEIIGAGIRVVEDDLDDDDCGTLYSYKLK